MQIQKKNNRLVYFPLFRRFPLSNPHSYQTVFSCTDGVGIPNSHLPAQSHSQNAVDSTLICRTLTWLGGFYLVSLMVPHRSATNYRDSGILAVQRLYPNFWFRFWHGQIGDPSQYSKIFPHQSTSILQAGGPIYGFHYVHPRSCPPYIKGPCCSPCPPQPSFSCSPRPTVPPQSPNTITPSPPQLLTMAGSSATPVDRECCMMSPLQHTSDHLHSRLAHATKQLPPGQWRS